jgi:branched-chain amino acid aminotransferase
MEFINHNGRIIDARSYVVTADNPALKYGDGVFETIRCEDYTLSLYNDHMKRLYNGMKKLGIAWPQELTERMQNDIIDLVRKNDLKDARIRLQVYRNNSSKYADYVIQALRLEVSATMNESGLKVCLFREAKKICDAFSNLKHCNYLAYIMAARYAKAYDCDDALLLNQYERICESSKANIFVVKDGVIYTPALSEGCIAGVYRQYLLKHFLQNGIPVHEIELTEAFMMEADEIFLTNAIQRIKWVGLINERKYGNNLIKKLQIPENAF